LNIKFALTVVLFVVFLPRAIFELKFGAATLTKKLAMKSPTAKC
jgi:hypothetical protein